MIGELFLLILSMVAVYGQGEDHHHHHHHLEEYIDYHSHPHYNFHYSVHDPKHHNIHDRWEFRDGHVTKGMYSLHQPDGRIRTVEYEADKHGINYNVKYEGHAIHWDGHKHQEEHHLEDPHVHLEGNQHD